MSPRSETGDGRVALPMEVRRAVGWLERCGLAVGVGAWEAQRKAGRLAEHLAARVQGFFLAILVLEGMAALLPLLWLVGARYHFHPGTIAGLSFAGVATLTGVCWWLRWAGTQPQQAGARLVAEVARSKVACADLPGDLTTFALRGVPSLQPLGEMIVAPAGEAKEDWHARRQRYRRERIEDQQAYYREKGTAAEKVRRRLSRILTRALDSALVLAVGGLVLALLPGAERWLRLSQSDLFLGLLGAALPLLVLIVQTLMAHLELNRRAGRYAQQGEHLAALSERIDRANGPEEFLAVARETESALLAEVLEWYYQAERAEIFYGLRGTGQALPKASEPRPLRPWLKAMVAAFGWSGAFAMRVIFGRLVIAALAAVGTTALISYLTPLDPSSSSQIHLADGRLLGSATADGWEPDDLRASRGFVLIAHGLRDGANLPDEAGAPMHWMAAMQQALIERMGSPGPEICLVDWHKAAHPSVSSSDGFAQRPAGAEAGAESSLAEYAAWLQDIARIRPQATEIGEAVGYKIARELRRGTLQTEAPMHLIGHSAGGFIVLRAAIVLQDLGLRPKALRITLLDTPMLEESEVRPLLPHAEIDFIHTSRFAETVAWASYGPHFHYAHPPVPAAIDSLRGAHAYACTWYTRTIAGAEPGGFSLSPLLSR